MSSPTIPSASQCPLSPPLSPALSRFKSLPPLPLPLLPTKLRTPTATLTTKNKRRRRRKKPTNPHFPLHSQIHALPIIKSDLHNPNPKASDHSVLGQGHKSNSFNNGHHLINEIPKREPSFYAKTIASHGRSQQWLDVLSVFDSMLTDGARPDKFLLPKILKACSELRNLGTGSAVHGYMVRSNVEIDVFVGNSLIDMYSKCGDLDSSRAVFDRMKQRDVVSWTALVNAYADAGLLDEAAGVFEKMRRSGVRPDLISWNALISGFARNAEIETALGLLEEMQEGGFKPGVNSWNGVISGCVQNGFFEEALGVFRWMCLRENPNAVTIASALPACSGLGALNIGKELHSHVLRRGLKMNVFVGGSMIDMYLKCGRREYAERVFSELDCKNSTVWNEMIAAFASKDNIKEALELLHLMREDGLEPDVITYNTFLATYARKGQKDEAYKLLAEMGEHGLKPNVISMNALISGFHHSGLDYEALELLRRMQYPGVSINPNAISITSALSVCTNLKLHQLGREIHSYVFRNFFEPNVFVSTALVDMYAKCEDMVSAINVFHGIIDKNTVTWNVLMAGHNLNGDPEAAIELFPEMLKQDFIPSSITFMILLLACGSATALRLGRELHGYIEKLRPDGYPVALASGLIGMYMKCGSISEARLVFDHALQKDVAVWNEMISGYSLHGMAKDAISLFNQMERSGIKPDHITIAAILSACKQEDLVDEGWKYFNTMDDVYGVTPTLEHFTCMVDIISSAGLLEEAMDFIRRMPFEPDACMWATLLKACRLHSNYKVGEKVARYLFELEPSNASNYVVLSNIFAMAGMWDSSIDIRNDMKARGLKMVRTCSWIYIGSTIHSFKAGDKSHPELDKILGVWDKFAGKMAQSGYVPHSVIFCDEEVDPFSCYHTEKLAVCLGVISLQSHLPIRVSKNVRMCMDCHSSMKFISKIVGRDIFVADGCAYHNFSNGMCSCRDRW